MAAEELRERARTRAHRFRWAKETRKDRGGVVGCCLLGLGRSCLRARAASTARTPLSSLAGGAVPLARRACWPRQIFSSPTADGQRKKAPPFFENQAQEQLADSSRADLTRLHTYEHASPFTHLYDAPSLHLELDLEPLARSLRRPLPFMVC